MALINFLTNKNMIQFLSVKKKQRQYNPEKKLEEDARNTAKVR